MPPSKSHGRKTISATQTPHEQMGEALHLKDAGRMKIITPRLFTSGLIPTVDLAAGRIIADPPDGAL